jgi:hypothetical protein
MYTALMSLGLIGLVAVSGVTFSRTMDEMFAASAALPTPAPAA